MNELLSRITIDPEICHGKPAIRHSRYPVESMLDVWRLATRLKTCWPNSPIWTATICGRVSLSPPNRSNLKREN
jgi:hypothetical protein